MEEACCAARGRDCLDHMLAGAVLDVNHEHARTLAGKRLSDLSTNALGRTSDNGHFAIQTQELSEVTVLAFGHQESTEWPVYRP
jgi:hypothetical protein